MRLASLKSGGVALVKDSGMVPLGDVLQQQGILSRNASMMDLIAAYDRVRESVRTALERPAEIPLGDERLDAPVPQPTKVWAAASNYQRGSSGLEDARGRGAAAAGSAEELLGSIFLKPTSAVIGPGGTILVPRGVDTIFPEVELCIVIGKKCHNVPKDRALDAVFGYTIILDVTARGTRWGKDLVSRCVRKGYDTFAPTGPWITTRDEIRHPQDLAMKLWVNGELRQSAKTTAMINGVADLVSYLSWVCTLNPGDLIATGNPDDPSFQKQLLPGDSVKAEIEGIGALNLRVAQGS